MCVSVGVSMCVHCKCFDIYKCTCAYLCISYMWVLTLSSFCNALSISEGEIRGLGVGVGGSCACMWYIKASPRIRQ